MSRLNIPHFLRSDWWEKFACYIQSVSGGFGKVQFAPFHLQTSMDDVAAILRCFPSNCQPTRVEPLGSVGGLSGAQFWRLVAPRGALGLRRWPIEHPTPDGLEFIHAVLRHAAQRGLQVLPVPIAATDGSTIVRHAG